MTKNFEIGFVLTGGSALLIILGVACATQDIKFDGQMLMITLVIIGLTAWRVSLIKPEIFS